jgi:hypothetical protein
MGGCVDLTAPWANQVDDASMLSGVAPDTPPAKPDAPPSTGTDDSAPNIGEDALLADRLADGADDGGPDVTGPSRDAGSNADATASDSSSDVVPKRDTVGPDATDVLADATPDGNREDTPQLTSPDACAACDRPIDKTAQDEPLRDTLSPDLSNLDGTSDASSLTVGLVGHWTFDEGSGSIANDSSGNGISGKLLNVPVWSTDCAPRRHRSTNLACLHFDGTSQSVLIEDAAVANFSGPISISAWVKTDAAKSSSTSFPVFRNIMVKGYSDDPWAEVSLRLQNNAYAAGSYDGQDHQVVSDTALGDVGDWVHLAGVYDGTTWRLYRNGDLEAATKDTVGAVEVPLPWSIGASSSGTMRFFNGSIDDVRLYKRALSADEVSVLAAGI